MGKRPCDGVRQYPTQKAAEQAIEMRKIVAEPGFLLVIKSCEHCFNYHIHQEPIPIEQIQLPQERDDYALITSCHSKRAYISEKEALRVARGRDVPLRAYLCETCGNWHLTKQLQRRFT